MMVSYARARAEGLGVECREGWMQRPERIILLVIGSLMAGLPVVGTFLIQLTLCITAVLANVTAFQRIFLVKRKLPLSTGDV
jgi:CDP-diacylglycerol--glycerol-3-phosphate 3-phosphatidyltransferase